MDEIFWMVEEISFNRDRRAEVVFAAGSKQETTWLLSSSGTYIGGSVDERFVMVEEISYKRERRAEVVFAAHVISLGPVGEILESGEPVDSKQETSEE